MIGWSVELLDLEGDIISEEVCLEWWEVQEVVEELSHTLDFQTSIMISVIDDIEIEEEERWTIL